MQTQESQAQLQSVACVIRTNWPALLVRSVQRCLSAVTLSQLCITIVHIQVQSRTDMSLGLQLSISQCLHIFTISLERKPQRIELLLQKSLHLVTLLPLHASMYASINIR